MSVILSILLCGFIVLCVWAFITGGSEQSNVVKCEDKQFEMQDSKISLDLDITKF